MTNPECRRCKKGVSLSGKSKNLKTSFKRLSSINEAEKSPYFRLSNDANNIWHTRVFAANSPRSDS
jgi:hypothetical protein